MSASSLSVASSSSLRNHFEYTSRSTTIPIVVLSFLFSILRHTILYYLTRDSPDKSQKTPENIRNYNNHLARITNLQTNRMYLTKKGFLSRKKFYMNNPNIVKAPQELESSANSGMMTNFMKTQLRGFLILYMLQGIVKSNFQEKIAAIVPFPLPQRLASFMQEDLNLSIGETFAFRLAYGGICISAFAFFFLTSILFDEIFLHFLNLFMRENVIQKISSGGSGMNISSLLSNLTGSTESPQITAIKNANYIDSCTFDYFANEL
ncbi:MAG: ER membrane complex subunit 3 [Marteilia pararefringens]